MFDSLWSVALLLTTPNQDVNTGNVETVTRRADNTTQPPLVHRPSCKLSADSSLEMEQEDNGDREGGGWSRWGGPR